MRTLRNILLVAFGLCGGRRYWLSGAGNLLRGGGVDMDMDMDMEEETPFETGDYVVPAFPDQIDQMPPEVHSDDKKN